MSPEDPEVNKNHVPEPLPTSTTRKQLQATPELKERTLSVIGNSLSSPSPHSSQALSPVFLAHSWELLPKQLQSYFWSSGGGSHRHSQEIFQADCLSPCSPLKVCGTLAAVPAPTVGPDRHAASSLESGQAQLTYQADGGGAQRSWQVSSVTLTPDKPQKQVAKGGSRKPRARSYSRLLGPHRCSLRFLYGPSLGQSA